MNAVMASSSFVLVLMPKELKEFNQQLTEAKLILMQAQI